jgi:hypothetical protein
VRGLGAIQSQDFAAAKWAIGMRVKGATDESIEHIFNEGKILRTHVMRPTWHFVLPEDIRWMLELTAPRILPILAHYDRKLELTEPFLSECYEILTKALRGNTYLTRLELANQLKNKGIVAHGQRLGHIVAHAELAALICSGPRRGKQFTYALLEERVPKVARLDRHASLAKLARKYFTSHGPAQIKDFAWWGGLTMKDAQLAAELSKKYLEQEEVEGKVYWFAPSANSYSIKSPCAHLLSIYDEYTIAYKDRDALGGKRYVEKLLAMGNALTSVVTIDGIIVGTWKRTVHKDSITIFLRLFEKHTPSEMKAIEREASLYGKFLNMPVSFS